MALIFSCVSEYGDAESCKYVVGKEDTNDNLKNVFDDIFPTNVGSPKIW